MNLELHDPRAALNKAFRKVKPNRADFETFKAQLSNLLAGVKTGESEEFHKNLIAEFLKKSYYDAAHAINTKERSDLVIHEGKTADTPVAVILETKKPDNKSEMPVPTDLNRKALHELTLYYLRERVTNKNLSVKHLIVTNTYEWFIFDASAFEKAFVEHKAFVKQYEDFAAGRLTSHKTEFFYSSVAKPFIAGLDEPLPFTYVDLRDYQPYTGAETESADEKKLITLYKLFSPEHLLKLPFANDSNTLDRTFYAELLHIIGLTEVKEGGKKLIERQAEAARGVASILENTIVQLGDRDKLSRLDDPQSYGSTREEQLFNVALELSITWVNRVLFLKLLESQLKSYHRYSLGESDDYSFLNPERLKNYDDLNTLFFGVLARPVNERSASVKEFERVPYLNSSLFELSELEHRTLDMSALRDERELPLYPGTVLKDAQGKRRTGRLSTLEYLFEFLDAYDFSSEGTETVQEERKTLINASVLGLIFEKINGYKDGSFFTPGFITMYMCRETVRRAVVQKFNEVKGWACRDFDELYNKIDNKREANTIVNSVKVCDPAVGSGHFLVSTLNELLSIKGELKVLLDENGKMLRDYTFEVISDELVVTDSDGELFAYNPKNAESQRVQKTLFDEKQTLIENCLFGVDLNPNSVKICRLRLWIELLKHAYYKADGQLETLPNIDINIKTGNSLVSRFALDADLKQALKNSDTTIEDYQNAVNTYRNATSKEEKREMERLIERIKGGFRTEIANNDPKVIRLENLRVRLATLEQTQLFEETAAQKKELEKLAHEIAKLSAELEAVRSNKVFEQAFEWRFEFPEVLNDNGDFIGFDVIIGNPPWLMAGYYNESNLEYLRSSYKSAKGKFDLYYLFVEKGWQLLNPKGFLSLIVPNKFFHTKSAKELRGFLVEDKFLTKILDFGYEQVFSEATNYSCILFLDAQSEIPLKYISVNGNLTFDDERQIPWASLSSNTWSFEDKRTREVFKKLNALGQPLQELTARFGTGVQSGSDKILTFQEDELDSLDFEPELLIPMLRGRDVRRYNISENYKHLIFPYSVNQSSFEIYSEQRLQESRKVYEHLENNKNKLANRKWFGKTAEELSGKWYGLVYLDSYKSFNSSHLLTPSLSNRSNFALGTGKLFATGTAGVTSIILSAENMEQVTYFLGILNSRLLSFYITAHSPVFSGGYYKFSSPYLKDVPIRTINFSDPADKQKHDAVVGLVETMLSLHEQKAATTDASERALLEREIAATDAEINRLVYRLYDLTDEEIKIVEGSGV